MMKLLDEDNTVGVIENKTEACILSRNVNVLFSY